MLSKSSKMNLHGLLTVEGTIDPVQGTVTLTVTISKVALAAIENSRDAQANEAVQIAREGRLSGEASKLLRGWAFVAKYLEDHWSTSIAPPP